MKISFFLLIVLLQKETIDRNKNARTNHSPSGRSGY